MPKVLSSLDAFFQYGGPLFEIAAQYLNWSVADRRSHLRRERYRDVTAGFIHLYKYRSVEPRNEDSVEKLRQLIVKNRIWSASPDSLNDPDDLRFKVVFSSDVEERRAWIKQHFQSTLSPAKSLMERRRYERASLTVRQEEQFKEEIRQHTGVFCASVDPRVGPLWSHYADNHHGICIQFSTFHDPLFLLSKEVVYGDDFPELRIPSSREKVFEYFNKKSANWAYEKECRIVLPVNNCLIELQPLTITSVILGARSSAATLDCIHELNEERKIAGGQSLKIYKAKQRINDFGVTIRKLD